MIRPPFLQAGDTVAITSTARWADLEAINVAKAELESWGYQVQLGKYICETCHQFAGTDEQRIAEFHRFVADPQVKAVLFSRGGYGTTRLIDQLDWNLIMSKPKWYCGFSDVTALLCHLEKLGMQSLHSPMAAQFATSVAERRPSLLHLKEVLQGKSVELQAEYTHLNRTGEAEGILVGGNLSLLNTIIATASEPDYTGKILFMEDLDEYLYHIDRMMVQLKRSGRLSQLAGVVVGQMSDMNDNATPFGQGALEIINEHLGKYNYPVAFGMPIGHETINMAVPVGARFRLTVTDKISTLAQI
jgi:muramoyltetrapeptide carboxypeptidase